MSIGLVTRGMIGQPKRKVETTIVDCGPAVSSTQTTTTIKVSEQDGTKIVIKGRQR